MSQPSSRSVDARANLVKGLKVLQSLGIGVVVLETAERVRANKEECIEIAQRAAQLILELEPQLSPDDISEDLRLRLEAYSSVLREVSETVTRIGAKSKWKRAFRSASVSEETKDCLNKLDNAYQDFLVTASPSYILIIFDASSS
ncbi:hypothetical protein SISSUDRAFT_584815 [Sistotremastrum suecicum HHB10207 ss-3]|uniref:Mixed lineage kinase domain-containing protein n=1 Tax=Sistotremastrum suecicum HHB10207 ss-3 TaxID=1314776 RepID=A0A165XEC6_9AGAM|nr:hypothetical protein SISSUDRAFT_584815 [Sistotremastrum suecicum HHB10207 ss-3]